MGLGKLLSICQGDLEGIFGKLVKKRGIKNNQHPISKAQCLQIVGDLLKYAFDSGYEPIQSEFLKVVSNHVKEDKHELESQLSTEELLKYIGEIYDNYEYTLSVEIISRFEQLFNQRMLVAYEKFRARFEPMRNIIGLCALQKNIPDLNMEMEEELILNNLHYFLQFSTFDRLFSWWVLSTINYWSKPKRQHSKLLCKTFDMLIVLSSRQADPSSVTVLLANTLRVWSLYTQGVVKAEDIHRYVWIKNGLDLPTLLVEYFKRVESDKARNMVM